MIVVVKWIFKTNKTFHNSIVKTFFSVSHKTIFDNLLVLGKGKRFENSVFSSFVITSKKFSVVLILINE